MSATFVKARKKILDADIDFLADDIKAKLIDIADTTAVAITGATNATPIVITATSHGFANGDYVSIHGVAGNTAANGHYKVANQAANTFELTDPRTGANVAGSGAYTSGGYALPLGGYEFVSDITGAAIVATSGNLASKTTTSGVFDAADATFSAVTGDACEVLFLVKDTGVSATSPVIAVIDSFTSGMPVTPNGGDINVTWNASGILSLI